MFNIFKSRSRRGCCAAGLDFGMHSTTFTLESGRFHRESVEKYAHLASKDSSQCLKRYITKTRLADVSVWKVLEDVDFVIGQVERIWRFLSKHLNSIHLQLFH